LVGYCALFRNPAKAGASGDANRVKK